MEGLVKPTRRFTINNRRPETNGVYSIRSAGVLACRRPELQELSPWFQSALYRLTPRKGLTFTDLGVE
jgi:hypothetical protein